MTRRLHSSAPLDRTDASILATVVFIIVFVLLAVISTALLFLVGLQLKLFSVLGGGSGFSMMDFVLVLLLILAGWAAYVLSSKTYHAVRRDVPSP